jgi:hypothetical protein
LYDLCYMWALGEIRGETLLALPKRFHV